MESDRHGDTVIAGYFRGVYISRIAIQFLFAKSNFTNGDTEPRLLHINYFSRFKFSRIGCAFAKFAKYKRLENNPLYGSTYMYSIV